MGRLGYRINKPTLAILTLEDERVAVRVPSNSVVLVIDDSDQEPLVEVEWEGKRISMFVVDLRDRGEPMRTRSVVCGSD